jgi:hypothetical protein
MLDNAIPTTQFALETNGPQEEDGSIIEEKMYVRKFAKEFCGKFLGTTHCHSYIIQKEIYLFILPLSLSGIQVPTALCSEPLFLIAEFLSRHKGGT